MTTSRAAMAAAQPPQRLPAGGLPPGPVRLLARALGPAARGNALTAATLLPWLSCSPWTGPAQDPAIYRLLSLPVQLIRHARARIMKISRTWPWKDAFLACWQRLCALPAPV